MGEVKEASILLSIRAVLREIFHAVPSSLPAQFAGGGFAVVYGACMSR